MRSYWPLLVVIAIEINLKNFTYDYIDYHKKKHWEKCRRKQHGELPAGEILWYAILKYDMHFEQVFFKGELQVVIYSLFNSVKLGIINQ